jgi:uncharacterized protein (TIGR03435 family)
MVFKIDKNVDAPPDRFEAFVEQLGLRLETAKVFVIDSVQRPSEN